MTYRDAGTKPSTQSPDTIPNQHFLGPVLATMLFTRQELLKALPAMDVSIPLSTKLSDEALEKRLRQALNASQVSSQLITKSPINIKSLHKWPLGSSLYESVRRGNWQESMANYSSRMGGSSNTEASALSGNAFMDLRQTILSLANSWDKGSRVAVMQDEDHEKCAVNIRVCRKLSDILART